MPLGISLNLFRSPIAQSAQSLRLSASSQAALGTSSATIFGSSSDAVRITLSKEARANSTTQASEKLNQDPIVKGPPSQLRSLISTLADITKQIASFSQELNQENLGEERRAVLGTEISNLNAEYKRVVESKQFNQIIEIGQSVQSALSAGADGSKLASSLLGNIGLLGSDFLGLVQNGELARLGKVTTGFGSLAGTDITAAASNTEGANSVLGMISDISQALDGSTLSAEQGGQKLVPMLNTSQAVPGIQQTVYSGDMEFALALRSYAPADLLQAAVSGVEIDPVGELMLVANPDRDKDGNGKDDREEIGKV